MLNIPLLFTSRVKSQSGNNSYHNLQIVPRLEGNAIRPQNNETRIAGINVKIQDGDVTQITGINVN